MGQERSTNGCPPLLKSRGAFQAGAGPIALAPFLPPPPLWKAPAHGAGERPAGGASAPSSPAAAPPGAQATAGAWDGETLCGWGGRLHGFRQRLWSGL
ncbi:hypothetical protein GCM10010469_26030 [Streptomyces labedae]|uniref:Uncharacterized protein n=1 Tax=Streptomyces labedae TaxID=285569 RepID=A0ABP6QXQ8_9ACTN